MWLRLLSSKNNMKPQELTYWKKESPLACIFAVFMDVNLNEQRTRSKIKTQWLLYFKTSVVIHSIVNLSTLKASLWQTCLFISISLWHLWLQDHFNDKGNCTFMLKKNYTSYEIFNAGSCLFFFSLFKMRNSIIVW